MLPLAELQRQFLDALFAAGGAVPATLSAEIRSGDFSADERIAVYRNNLRAGFRKALALEFPVLEQLVGAAYFDQLACEFQAAFPSRSGDLQRIGAPLAEFLRARFVATEYAYFPDVAALEWAWQDSMTAPDAASALDLVALAQLPPESLPLLRFELQPALRRIASPWPVFTIWDAHRRAAQLGQEPQAIDPGSGGECVIVRRVARVDAGAGVGAGAGTGAGAGAIGVGVGVAEARLCSRAEFEWFDALAGGATLGAALDVAIATDAGFDLGATLQRAAALGLVTAFSL
jgi:hypothetical protein